MTVHEQLIRELVLDRFASFFEPRFVRRSPASSDCRLPLLQLERQIGGNRVVVREAVLFAESEHAEETLIQFLFVHANERQDRTLSPLSEAARRTCEVRIVRLEHRDRHAEDGGDLLDDLFASGDVLRREVQRRELDVARDRDEVPVFPRASKTLLDLLLEAVELVPGRRSLHHDGVVRTRRVLERREVHLMQCLVRRNHAERRFDLAHSIEQVPRIRSPEVDHLIRLEDLFPLRVHAVDVPTDERILVRDHLDVLRCKRPEFDRNAGRLVDDRMQIGVAGQFAVQDAKRREIEAVEVGVRGVEEIEDRMIDDLPHVVAVHGGLPEYRRRWPLIAGSIAEEIRLAMPRDRTRRDTTDLVFHRVEAERCSGDRVRVDRSGGVDPRTEGRDPSLLREVRTLRAVLSSTDDVHARSEILVRRGLPLAE